MERIVGQNRAVSTFRVPGQRAHGIGAGTGVAALFMLLASSLPGQAQEGLCRLALEVHTDATAALEGGALTTATAGARARALDRHAGGLPEIAFLLVRLSEAYGAYDEPTRFADLVFPVLNRLSSDRPECALPQMEQALDGSAVQWRPISADNANEEKGTSAWPGGDIPPEQTAKAIGVIALMLGVASWIHWHVIGRRQKAPRFPCDLPITVISKGKKNDTVLEDISAFGGRASVTGIGHDLKAGSRIRVTSAPFTRRARVRWVNDHYAGILFSPPLPEQLVGLIASCDADRTPKPEALHADGQKQPAT